LRVIPYASSPPGGERGCRDSRRYHEVQGNEEVGGLATQIDRDPEREHTEREQREGRWEPEDQRRQRRDSDHRRDGEGAELGRAVTQLPEALRVPHIPGDQRRGEDEREDHRRRSQARIAGDQ
jgi:hypothetical protein